MFHITEVEDNPLTLFIVLTLLMFIKYTIIPVVDFRLTLWFHKKKCADENEVRENVQILC